MHPCVDPDLCMCKLCIPALTLNCGRSEYIPALTLNCMCRVHPCVDPELCMCSVHPCVDPELCMCRVYPCYDPELRMCRVHPCVYPELCTCRVQEYMCRVHPCVDPELCMCTCAECSVGGRPVGGVRIGVPTGNDQLTLSLDWFLQHNTSLTMSYSVSGGRQHSFNVHYLPSDTLLWTKVSVLSIISCIICSSRGNGWIEDKLFLCLECPRIHNGPQYILNPCF